MRYLFIIVCLFLFACSGEDNGDSKNNNENETGNNTPTATYKINGFIQKGPFVAGADVLVEELDDNLNGYGKIYNSETHNALGAFNLEAEMGSRLVEIKVTGQYYNEVSAVNTEGTLSLRSLIDVSNDIGNVNLLTTLAAPRHEYLFKNTDPTGDIYDHFVTQRNIAQTEVLAAFNIAGILTPFTNMNISGVTEADAILLAISAIIQNACSNTGDVTEMISNISTDLEVDGVLNSTSIINKLIDSSKTLSLLQVKNNMEKKYDDLGHSINIAAFWEHIDSDGDGILNINDPDSPLELFDRKPIIQYTYNYENFGCSGGSSATGKYFAIPFQPDEDITAKYIVTTLTGDYLSIYTDNSGEPGSLLKTITKFNENYFVDTPYKDKDNNDITQIPSFSNLEFDTHGFQGNLGLQTFISGNRYWIVAHSNENYSATPGGCKGSVPFSERKYSIDGITWNQWSGGSNGVYADNIAMNMFFTD
jgi:hypothetical protein